MIEIRKDYTGVDEKESATYTLIVNGAAISSSEVEFDYNGKEISVINAESREIIELFQHRFNELPTDITLITSPVNDFSLDKLWLFSVEKKDGVFSVGFGLNFLVTISEWKYPWSQSEYADQFRRTVENSSMPELEYFTEKHRDQDNELNLDCDINFPVPNPQETIAIEVERRLDILRELHKHTVSVLLATARSNSLVAHFNFPESVRVPCEQYLLYFGQFLKDVGVKATTEINHSATGQVLFSVTPDSREDALEKIREALDEYLRLPSNPTIGVVPVLNESIEVQRLAANVQHLQSQIMLSRALVQTQAATIEAHQQTIAAQQSTISRQDVLLSPGMMVNSLIVIEAKGEQKDREEFLGGSVALTKVEAYGVELNLANIVRRAKKRFSRRNQDTEG